MVENVCGGGRGLYTSSHALLGQNARQSCVIFAVGRRSLEVLGSGCWQDFLLKSSLSLITLDSSGAVAHLLQRCCDSSLTFAPPSFVNPSTFLLFTPFPPRFFVCLEQCDLPPINPFDRFHPVVVSSVDSGLLLLDGYFHPPFARTADLTAPVRVPKDKEFPPRCCHILIFVVPPPAARNTPHHY